MEGRVTWVRKACLASAQEQVSGAAPCTLSPALTPTNNFCGESLQHWNKDPVEEKQTELKREQEH